VRKNILVLAALLAVPALAVAGCGGGGSSSTGSYGSEESSNSNAASESSGGGGYGYGSSGASKSASSQGGASITVSSASGVGKVLVDSEGMTVYYFEKDKQGGSSSTCNGACAAAWPPVATSGSAQAGEGAQASKLGTIKRSDGTTQVTYNGWPLYTYVKDTTPGEANGTDVKAFGGSWYPLHSNGEKAGE
jgi:predicted lipoprotein with Yx(FWY)xxD motif